MSLAYFCLLHVGSLRIEKLSRALLISLGCQACGGIPLIAPQIASRLLEQSSAPSCSSPGSLKWGQEGPVNSTKMQAVSAHRGSWVKVFVKKGNQLNMSIRLEAALWKAWLEWSRWKELGFFFALLWNVFNLCCWAATSSSSNKRADRLSLEINFIWKQHSPYGETVCINTWAFSSRAHFHSFISGFPACYTLSDRHCFSLSLCSSHSFCNSRFFPQGLSVQSVWSWCLRSARFQQPDTSWGKWKPHNGDATQDRRYGFIRAA